MENLWKSKKYLERKYHETILIKDIKESKNKQLKYNIDIYTSHICIWHCTIMWTHRLFRFWQSIIGTRGNTA